MNPVQIYVPHQQWKADKKLVKNSGKTIRFFEERQFLVK